MSKTLIGASIIGVSLIVAALVLVGVRGEVERLGGITNYDSVVLGGNLTTGGTRTISNTTQSSVTLSNSDLVNTVGETVFSTIAYTGVSTTTTVAFPASSTLTSFVPQVGQSVTYTFLNTGAGQITLANGTGVTIENAGTSTVASGRSARIQFVRLPNTNIEALVQVFN